MSLDPICNTRLTPNLPSESISTSITTRKRGGGKNKKNIPVLGSPLKIYYNNINGMMTKRESLNQIIQAEMPDIITLCETKLGAKSKPKIPGYETEYLNLAAGKEGLLVAAREGQLVSMEDVTSSTSREDKNILAVKVMYPGWSIRVVVAHAPQETDKQEIREGFFQNLKLEVERGELNGDSILVVGDMNGRVESGLENEDERLSPNGKYLKSLVDEHHLKIANFHATAIGKWTRIQQSKKGVVKSVIDYMLLDETLSNSVLELTIDECKLCTPYWITTKKGVRSIVSSDHCALTAKLDVKMESNEEPATREKIWKVTEAGLQKYKDLTSTRTLFFSNEEDSSEMYRLWWDHLEGTLCKCFKKKSIGKQGYIPCKHQGGNRVRAVLSKVACRGKIQREVVLFYKKRLFEWEYAKLEKKRVENLKNTLSNFSEDERVPPNAYWKVLKSVRGKEKTKISSLLKNDGSEVSSANGIKQEAIKEFQFRLRNREPGKGWEEYVRTTNKLVELLMSVDIGNSTDFTLAELLAAIKRLKRKKSPGIDGILGEFLIEAGIGILLPLLDIYNAVKNSKQPPKQWNDVIITIIYKNKGSRKQLVNYRGIFLASIVSKIFERLIKNRTRSSMEKINLCQAGSKVNRGPPDNIFILNAVVDHAIYLGKSVYITTYDFEQAFDSLWLEDCILSLRKLGISDEFLQLIFNLNKKAVIRVKTPHGLSPAAVVNDTVQQGRVLAPDLCSASTAEYCGVNKGVAVGTCIISSLAFVDDMLDASEDTYSAEMAHLQALAFSLRKKLEYNAPKCKAMMVNKKKGDKPPIMFIADHLIEIVSQIKYLGDIFQENGKNCGLIKDRVQRGVIAILKIEAILNETQFGKYTLEISLLLYRALFLSSILFNSQAWRNITEKDLASLQKIQLRLLRKIVNAPSSISKSFLFLELGVLPIRYEIHKRQITFLHHIINLDPNDPVHVLYQQMKCFPGESNWLNDVLHSAALYSIEIDEERIKSVSKETFKTLVKSAVQKYAFQSLKMECAKQSKTGTLVYEEFKPQPYLHHLYPSQAKTILQCRAKCLRIKSHRPYLFKNKICRWCNLEEEELLHIVNCGLDTTMVPVDLNRIDEVDELLESKLIQLASRVNGFLDLVDC